jgi:Tfp pilus assembly protein PilE
LEEFIVAFLSLACLILSVLLVFAIVSYSRVQRARTKARLRLNKYTSAAEHRSALILRELDDLFQKRTGLSNSLIEHAKGGETSSSFRDQSTDFMQATVETTAKLLNQITGDECAVSVKLFFPDAATSKPLVRTFFRDHRSAKRRIVEYEKLEPYGYEKNSILKTIIDTKPYITFEYSNNLDLNPSNYRNPNSNWRSHFRASAIHRISNPEDQSPGQTYGFLCADNRDGNFNDTEVRRVMSIVSTAIYYCIYATTALEFLEAAER